MNRKKLKDYWEKKGLEKGSQATMKDYHLRNLEIAALREELKKADIVLDVGAGNGASAIQLAPSVKKIILTDFASNMVREAEKIIAYTETKNAEAHVADVLNLSALARHKPSVVISTRCLINLTSFKDQRLALDQIFGVLGCGGRLLLLESTVDGWSNLSALRSEFGLNPITPHWHNKVFNKSKLIRELEKRFEIKKCINFGEYFVISRVLHPAYITPKEPSFDNPMNELAVRLWETRMVTDLEEFSPLLLFICKKAK
jgi:ubiquinone/menaquinone biosynthesis C-methylase UbiE